MYARRLMCIYALLIQKLVIREPNNIILFL